MRMTPQDLAICHEIHAGLTDKTDKDLKDIHYLFMDPVDHTWFTDYLSIVKRPMDLSTLKTNLDNDKYGNREEFYADVKLIGENAILFNKDKADSMWVVDLAKQLAKVFESLREKAEKNTFARAASGGGGGGGNQGGPEKKNSDSTKKNHTSDNEQKRIGSRVESTEQKQLKGQKPSESATTNRLKVNRENSVYSSPGERKQKDEKQKDSIDSSGCRGGANSMTEHEKKEKERFLMFTRVLMKYLEQRDLPMHSKAKAQIKECYEKNKSGVPQFKSLTDSMKERLRATVGEHYWKKAHDHLDHFLKKKDVLSMQCGTRPPHPQPTSTGARQSSHCELTPESCLQEVSIYQRQTSDTRKMSSRSNQTSSIAAAKATTLTPRDGLTARSFTRGNEEGDDNMSEDPNINDSIATDTQLWLQEMTWDIWNHILKAEGWKEGNGDALSDFMYYPANSLVDEEGKRIRADKIRKEGTRGVHFAYGWVELGKMIEKYGVDHAPKNLNDFPPELEEDERKTLAEIHDLLPPDAQRYVTTAASTNNQDSSRATEHDSDSEQKTDGCRLEPSAPPKVNRPNQSMTNKKRKTSSRGSTSSEVRTKKTKNHISKQQVINTATSRSVSPTTRDAEDVTNRDMSAKTDDQSLPRKQTPMEAFLERSLKQAAEIAKEDSRKWATEKDVIVQANEKLMEENKQKEAQIISMTTELSRKDAQLATKDQEIDSKDKTIAEKNVMIANKDTEIASMRAALASKNERLTSFEAYLRTQVHQTKVMLDTIDMTIDEAKPSSKCPHQGTSAKSNLAIMQEQNQKMVQVKQEKTVAEANLRAEQEAREAAESNLESVTEDLEIHQDTVQQQLLAQDVWMRRFDEIASRVTAGGTVDAAFINEIRGRRLASGR